MPIWELAPTDKSSGDWRASRYKGRVVVRAFSEDQARNLVSSKLHDASKKIPGGDTPLNPWRQSDLVVCKILKDSDYDENGPDEILDPKGFLAIEPTMDMRTAASRIRLQNIIPLHYKSGR